MIFDSILLCLALGVATYALTNTVTEHEGPMHVFARLRGRLLPNGLKPVCFDIDYTDIEPSDSDIQDGYYTLIEDYQKELDFIVALLEHDDSFNHTLKGTLFNILNCKYCFGVYAALVLSLPLTLVFFGLSGLSVIIGLSHWWVAIGLQRFLIALIDEDN